MQSVRDVRPRFYRAGRLPLDPVVPDDRMEEQPGELQEEAGKKEEGVEVDQKPRCRQILQQEKEEEHRCTTKNYDDPGSNDPTATFGCAIGLVILHTMATRRVEP